MSAAIQQIKIAYEVNEMTPEEISHDQDLDLEAVKAALMNSSAKYRKSCGLEDEDSTGLNFTNDELRRVNQVIIEAALTAEDSSGNPDWRTRLNAATYVRDDKKGRKEVIKHMQNNTFNILSFNEQLQRARQMSNNMKQNLIEA